MSAFGPDSRQLTPELRDGIRSLGETDRQRADQEVGI